MVDNRTKDARGPERQGWGFLRFVVRTLGENGMSSDESDRERGFSLQFRMKRMPWRKDVTKELRFIDDEIQKDRTLAQQSKTVARVRSKDAPTTTREEVHGLPRSFYNNRWYSSLTKGQRSLVNAQTDEREWLNVVATN